MLGDNVWYLGQWLFLYEEFKMCIFKYDKCPESHTFKVSDMNTLVDSE